MHIYSSDSTAPGWAWRLTTAASGGLKSPDTRHVPPPVGDQFARSPQQILMLHWTPHPRLAQALGAAVGPALAHMLRLQQQGAMLVTNVYSAEHDAPHEPCLDQANS